MSEDVAGSRIAAARLANHFPIVLEMLADRRLYLSGLRLLRPQLSPDDREGGRERGRELLAAAANKSKRQIEKLLAARFPKPDVKPTIRKLPSRRPTSTGPGVGPAGSARGGVELALNPPCGAGEPAPAAPTPPPPDRPTETGRPELSHPAPSTRRPDVVSPLRADRFEVRFTASEELATKLQRAKALLSHTEAGADLASVVDRAVTMLIEAEEKRRFGAPRKRKPKKAAAASETSAPEASEHATARAEAAAGTTEPGGETTVQAAEPEARAESEGAGARPEGASADAPKPPRSRYIPAAIRREVYERDGGRCSFRGPDGRRCGETHRLELDHYPEPWACGGDASAAGLRVVCKAHNQYAARQVYGRRHVQTKIEEARRARQRE